MADTEFNGLTGSELKILILKVLEKTLDADTNFGLHMAYPRVRFEVTVEIDAYPRSPGKTRLVAGGSHLDPAFRPEAGEKPRKFRLSAFGPDVGATERMEEGPRHLAGHL